MKNMIRTISVALGVAAGVFSAAAEDTDWIYTTTRTYTGGGTSVKYNSDQYLAGYDWNTASAWLGGVIPGTTLGTVFFTNTLVTSAHWLQAVTWTNNLTIAKLEGNPIHVLGANANGVVMTIGDASQFDGVLRSMGAGLAVSGTPISGYAFSASTTVPRFAADGYPQLKVANAAHTVTAKSVYGRGTIVKTGSGTLNIADGSYQAKVRLQGGTLELPGHDYPDELVSGYEGNFDASASGKLETAEGSDGRIYVTRWNAASGSNYFKTTNDVMRPYLRENYANGKPVVDFGAFKGFADGAPGIGESRWDELGLPAYMEIYSTMSMKSVFYVQEETSRTNNGAVAFGCRGGAALYRMYDKSTQGYVSPTWSGVLSAWYEPKALQHGDMRVNNMRVSHDHYEPGGFARMMVYSQSEYAPEEAVQYIHMLGSDRYKRFGGMRLGQLVSYNKVLSTEEIRQNNVHLAKKWLGPVAEAVDADVGAVFVTSGGTTLSVPADATAVIPALVGGTDAVNGAVKTGAGTLVLDEVNLANSKIAVNAGKIAFRDLVAKTAPDDSAPAAEPCFWLKAANDDGTLSDSLVTETVNGTNFVSRWNDCRGNGRYAYVPASYGKYSPEKPYVTANAANGKPVVDFGQHADYATGKIPGMLFNVEGSGKNYVNAGNAMEAFVMFRHKDAANYQAWIFTSAGGTEFVNSFGTGSENNHRILNVQYADRRTIGADWFRDGRRVDPQDCAMDSDYHVLNFATFNAVNLEALSIDRWASYGTRGGGIEVGEYIVFDRVLTDAERRQTEAYLLKKWKNAVHPRTAAREVGTLAFADGVTPEIENEGNTVINEITTMSDTLKFTGSGTVTIEKLLPTTITTIDAGGVRLVLPADTTGDRIIREKSILDFDASRTETMTFDADQPDRIRTWRDANGKTAYYARNSAYVTNMPQLVDVTINGQTRKAVNFFEFCETPNQANTTSTNLATALDFVDSDGNWSSYGVFKFREAHVVMADHASANPNWEHRAITIDTRTVGTAAYYRSNAKPTSEEYGYILRETYSSAASYASWFACDGTAIPVSQEKGTPGCRIRDFDFHVYSFSNTNVVSGAGTELTDFVRVSTLGVSKTGNQGFMIGGKYICEIVYFADPLSETERAIVHDHLRRKWQSADVTSDALAFDEITLSGNELDYGTAQVSTEKLSGTGTLSAMRFLLAENGEMDFTFTDVDQVGAIAVNGAFSLPSVLTVRIGADPEDLKVTAGDYTLLTAALLTGEVDGVTVVNGLGHRRYVRIVKDGNALKARVSGPGFTVNFR